MTKKNKLQKFIKPAKTETLTGSREWGKFECERRVER